MTFAQSLQTLTLSLQSQILANQTELAAVTAGQILQNLGVNGSGMDSSETVRIAQSLGTAGLAKQGPDAFFETRRTEGLKLAVAGDRPLPDLDELAEKGLWGPQIFEKAKQGWRSPMRWLQDRVFDEMMRDPALKKRMIAFLDVSTGVPPASLPDYLREYFPRDALPSSGLLSLLLRVGRASWIPKGLVSFGIQAGLKNMAGRFLAGEDVQEAVASATRLRKDVGANTTLDVVWEHVVSEKEADDYQKTVMDLMDAWDREPIAESVTAGGVPVRHISVKLSALTSRFEPLAGDLVMERAGQRLLAIFQKAKALKAAGRPVLINIDLEERQVRDLSYRVVWETLNHASLDGWDEVGMVCQAYMKDSESVLMQLIDLAGRSDKKVQIRIVKGAYHQYEQIVAARKGWDVPVYLSPEETDHNFQRLVRLALLNHEKIRVAVGSHNLLDVALTQNLRESLNIPKEMVEQQFLLGVGDHLVRATATSGIPTRFYGPFGDRRKAIGYQMRRLDEVTPDSAIGQTRVFGKWIDYVRARRRRWAERKQAVSPEPSADVFRNEPEANFADGRVREAMRQALVDRIQSDPPRVVPLIGVTPVPFDPDRATVSVEPAAPGREFALVQTATAAQVDQAVKTARNGFLTWSSYPQEWRSEHLRRAAQIARDRRYAIAADIVLEAGKSWAAALADVEEGIDFLEAYARDGLRESPHRAPLGVGVAITPFNYPFAIAMGEVVGGLALGNAMILKPANTTTLIGRHVVQVLRDGGVPPEAVQFLPGAGSVVGQALVKSPDVDFIVLTGSKDTADRIIQTAAEHPPRNGGMKVVVAETGGKNPLIVDESADLDVAVEAILAGAFGMTGQRCSATSRVIVVESRAEELVNRLIEGARAMVVGDPRNPATQVGPLIDAAARRKVLEYIGIGTKEATLKYAGPTPRGGSGGEPTKSDAPRLEPQHPARPVQGGLAAEGFFVGPHIFTDVDPKSRLGQEEIFGPVLAVMTAKDFDDAMRIANEIPYGLTAALISRHPGHIRRFFEEIEAGVAYVNRAQIGARVVEQPFGGAKDSGTGPKAGGPHYVARFGKPRQPSTVLSMAFAQAPRIVPRFLQVEEALPSLRRSLRDWRRASVARRLEPLRRLRGRLHEGLLEHYLESATALLNPQTTLDLPGEINEEAHDWPLGIGAVWTQGESSASVLAAAAAALVMGNGVVLPDSPVAQRVGAALIEAGFPQELVAISSERPQNLLAHSAIGFLVSHGQAAAALARDFIRAGRGRTGFRRFIGVTDSPLDPGYLARFAHSRMRSERTLRHGADLDLRRSRVSG